MLNADALADMRLEDMPADTADAIRDAMLADGYLERSTFNPFAGVDPTYAWLRREYAQTALANLVVAA